MVVAELAVIAFLFNLFEILGRKLRRVALVLINAIEEGIEGRAEVETAAASVTDVIDAQGFFFKLRTIPAWSNQVKSLHSITWVGES